MEKKKQKSKLVLWLKKQLDKLWGWIKPYLTTWQGVAGMLLAWLIIDGSPYILIAIGTAKHIGWMVTVGATAEFFLWQPWMIEKPIVVIPLGILFKKGLDRLTLWFKRKKASLWTKKSKK